MSRALNSRYGFVIAQRWNEPTSGKRNGIRAHVGAEVSIASLGERLTPPSWLPHQHETEPARLPLLCESREGYQNLCQLITQLKMRESIKAAGAATFDDLQQYASGLICLTSVGDFDEPAQITRGRIENNRVAPKYFLPVVLKSA